MQKMLASPDRLSSISPGYEMWLLWRYRFTLGRILDGKEDVFGPPRFKRADMEAADAESEYLSFFKTKVVDVNRTSRGSKTGGIGRFSALVVVGNSNVRFFYR